MTAPFVVDYYPACPKCGARHPSTMQCMDVTFPMPSETPEKKPSRERLMDRVKELELQIAEFDDMVDDLGNTLIERSRRIAELERRLAEKDNHIGRLEGRMCLICGLPSKAECPSRDMEMSPCTFDPSPIEAARMFLERATQLEAKIAEQAGELELAKIEMHDARERATQAERQLAEAAAREAVLREALKPVGSWLDYAYSHDESAAADKVRRHLKVISEALAAYDGANK